MVFSLSHQQFVLVFSGENYDFWSIKLKTILRAYELWEVVESGNPQTVETTPTKEESTEHPVYIVSVIEDSGDLSQFSLTELVGSVQAHEQTLSR
ncbi:DUF4219 domain-containing protein [Cephalotus follicularis]|uniref:DUF4219 domain-containing protein n=1 Tax=Cephalotus follicularis TaxID=3775 RepID=A0A1Q3CV02_CEPFO|nr:DUF4219 domain-containing protein [Cephalotus follicularis]